jgi:hypothetical protein
MAAKGTSFSTFARQPTKKPPGPLFRRMLRTASAVLASSPSTSRFFSTSDGTDTIEAGTAHSPEAKSTAGPSC